MKSNINKPETSESSSLSESLRRSEDLQKMVESEPDKFLVLTGDRPTGKLHIGHYFGSLQNRVVLQNLGLSINVVIADYQVLTDHDSHLSISQNIFELVLDYLAAGLNPEKFKVNIFPHSQIPELNQLLLPFLNLVTLSELSRNPTVKEEIQSAGLKNVNAGMYTYPVHQAADILFCKANLIPVGKDQLPHLELSRTIAKRFNSRYCPNGDIFPIPQPLLSKSPLILGLDGNSKMSKSRNNAIYLSSTADETAQLIKKAKTDAIKDISYDPEKRPEVANLIMLTALCTGQTPESISHQIGNRGAGELKRTATEAINEYFRELRNTRLDLQRNTDFIQNTLIKGIKNIRRTAISTLEEVRTTMNMKI